jgi:hypothetical protein
MPTIQSPNVYNDIINRVVPYGQTPSGSLIPISPAPPSDVFALAKVDTTTTPNVTYMGYEAIDDSWYIKSIDESSGVVITHATVKNNSTYTTLALAWAAIATLTYGSFSEAFA